METLQRAQIRDFHDPTFVAMDPRKLLEILSDGRWHSPNSLREALGCDARLLDDWLAQLQSYDLEIRRDSRQGISLPLGLSLLESRQVLQGLSSAFRESIAHLELPLVVDSTNTRAMEWLRSGNAGRALFLAEKQRSGRGRRGRVWISPMARNLTMSLVWPVAGITQAQEGFSLVVALSLVECLRAMGLQGSEMLRVKWPNDVWLGDAKLAGILLELHGGSAGPHHVVIGIGVNVHMPEKALADIEQPVTDLYSQGNRQLDRNQLVTAILNSLERNLETLQTEGFDGFRQQWQRLDVFHDRQVEVLGDGQQFVGTVRGVNASGALILETDNGERHVSGGEIAPTVRSLRQQSKLMGQD